MANYPMPRLLLSIHTTPSSPTTTTTTTSVPEYSDVVIIFICLLCALICAVGVLGMIQWTCLRRSLPSTSATRTNNVEAPSECFKKKVVESLLTLVYKSSTNEGKEECVICLSDFVDGEEIRVLPRCAHVFHVGCIDTWLIGSNSLCCPSCRQVLVDSGCHKCNFDASAARPQLPTQIQLHYLP